MIYTLEDNSIYAKNLAINQILIFIAVFTFFFLSLL